MKKTILGFLVALLLPWTVAHAQDDSIDRILNKKKITIAVMNEVPPYSQLNANNENVGFDIDLANKLAADLGVEADLMVIPSANRLPVLVSRQADLTIATLLLTPARSAVVAQSIPYSAFTTVILGVKDKKMESFDDLRDGTVRVGAPRAAISDIILSREVGVDKIQRFEDDVTAIQALVSGQIDASAFGSLVAADIMARNPNANLEVKFTAATDYTTIGVNRADQDLLRWVNAWIFYMKIHGFLNEWHQKWLKTDMPELPTY